MSILSLISGSVFREPQRKTSKSGKPYLLLTLKFTDSNSTTFVHCFVFSEAAIEEVEALGDGDAIAVIGSLSIELYEGKPSLSIMVSKAIALKREKRTKPPKQKSSPQPQAAVDDFGDSVPF